MLLLMLLLWFQTVVHSTQYGFRFGYGCVFTPLEIFLAVGAAEASVVIKKRLEFHHLLSWQDNIVTHCAGSRFTIQSDE